jgi:hypothetical protein
MRQRGTRYLLLFVCFVFIIHDIIIAVVAFVFSKGGDGQIVRQKERGEKSKEAKKQKKQKNRKGSFLFLKP